MALTDTAIVKRRLLAAGSVGAGVGAGDWEVEGLVLKVVEPIRTPTIPVMMIFCMAKGIDRTILKCQRSGKKKPSRSWAPRQFPFENTQSLLFAGESFDEIQYARIREVMKKND
jgi:hypothetical protein